MVITVLEHGLGNQLFQYAVGRAAAARLGTGLWLDVSRFGYVPNRNLDLTKFRLRAKVLPDSLAKLLSADRGINPIKNALKALLGMSVQSVVDRAEGYDERILQVGRMSRLDGYWQSERYFAHLRPQLTAELEPRAGLSEPLEAFSRRVAAEDSVAVHVRRGDLVKSSKYVETVGALGKDFYEDALTRLRERMPRARVYLFSDDPEWCEQNIPRVLPTEVVSGRLTHSAVEDLTVMKRCRHFVIANSTFSWWAAWLGVDPAKQVITPSRFHREMTAWGRDLLPAAWEAIEPVFEPIR